MSRVSDFIIQKLLSEGQKSGPAERFPSPGAVQQQGPGPSQEEMMQLAAAQGGQGGMMPGGPEAGGVDPKIDFVAKKLAMLEGSPEEKYQILMQILPQIAAVLGPGMAEAAQGPPPGQDQYDVSGQMGAMGR